MKYGSLKKQAVNSFRVSNFDGGLNLSEPAVNIEDNQLSNCQNMWFKDGRLQTRPGFNAQVTDCFDIKDLRSYYDYEYRVTDSQVCVDGELYKIAVCDVLMDDYSFNTHVYLVGDNKEVKPIGKMTFLRTSSDIFYIPINVLFYSGKSKSGGGIFALVTLQNSRSFNDRYCYIYEINSKMTEWQKIYDYYIPTLYINGRGNKYHIGRSENKVTTATPKIVESPNMLNGRFHAYYTSDGYSNSFRLPFTNLAKEKVICRIYYTLVDYVEWSVLSQEITATKTFMGKSVTLEVDREKGTIYFTCEKSEYAIPVIPMYHENNIKITATKEIEDGFSTITYSTCSVIMDSKIIISGGKNGNEVYVADYNSPLYFPQGSGVSVGKGDSEITALSLQENRIIAFKKNEIYAMTLKKGDKISEISLLADNDNIFNECDRFETQEITKQNGCIYKNTLTVCNGNTVWIGQDDNIYVLNSVSGKEIINISQNIQNIMHKYNDETFVSSQGDYCFFANQNKIIVIEKPWERYPKSYYWKLPDEFTVVGSLCSGGKVEFLCVGEKFNLLYLAELSGYTDNYMYHNDSGEIICKPFKITSSITTKHFNLCKPSLKKNINSIYLMLSSKGKTKISVNGKEIANINLKISTEDYNKGEYKSVKLIPHIYNIDLVSITIESNDGINIGEMEIFYRKIG